MELQPDPKQDLTVQEAEDLDNTQHLKLICFLF